MVKKVLNADYIIVLERGRQIIETCRAGRGESGRLKLRKTERGSRIIGENCKMKELKVANMKRYIAWLLCIEV